MYSIQEVSARIKDLRNFNDYTVEEFAKKLGLTVDEYAEYESGEKDIPIGLLYNIATVLEVDASFILFGKGSTQRIATAVYNGNPHPVDYDVEGVEGGGRGKAEAGEGYSDISIRQFVYSLLFWAVCWAFQDQENKSL